MKYISICILLTLCISSYSTNNDDLSKVIGHTSQDNPLEWMYLEKAKSFNEKSNNDSAIYYLNKSKDFALENNITDSLFYSGLYEVYSTYYENQKNYKEAAYYKYLEQMNRFGSFQDNIEKAIQDVEKKYNRELVQNENNELEIRTQYLWISVLVASILILIIGFIYYYRKQKHEKELLEARQKIYDLKKMSETYNEKVYSARNILLQHLDVLKKSILLENFLREDEKIKGTKLLRKFNEIVYHDSSFDWDLLYNIINEINDNFFERIKEKYPILDDIEFKICCLIYIGFSNTEISIVLGKSINTIIAKRTSIRKKMEIKEHGNIVSFLNEDISNTQSK